MDLSGMIFVALAVVWAVYLIPRAVNRSEDELALMPAGWGEETSSVDADEESRPAAAPSRQRPAEVARRPLTPAERAAVRRAVARRRRVLLTLLALTAVTGVLSVTTPLAGWAAAVPGALVLVWLAVCRVQVRRLEAQRSERLRAEAAEVPEVAAEVAETEAAPEVEVATLREFRVEVPDSPAALVVEPDEDTVGLTEADRAAAVADEMPHGAVWDPRPLTLPTYISKPRARRVPRSLALDGAGVSSSGRDARDSALVAQGAYAGVDATAQPRQAVGS